MSDDHFSVPQHQAPIGILLIFAATIFKWSKAFGPVVLSFFISETLREFLLYIIPGLILVLLLTVIYSFLAFKKFVFYIDREKGEFVLEKGVFSSEVVSIPFHKIQQVNFRRNLLQRLVGVYSVLVDTAGSKDKEVEIKALSREKAERLGEALMAIAGKGREQTDSSLEMADGGTLENEAPVHWEFVISTWTLLKLGLTSNYFRGLAILTAFYFSLREQFQISEDFLEMPNVLLMEVASQVFLFLILILVGMLLTLGETFIKYYNLRVRRISDGLQVEMGLKENTRVNLKPQRVQLLQVLTNPLQKRLDLFKLKISLASSQEHNEKDKIRVPGLPREVVHKTLEYFYSSPQKPDYWILPHRIGLFRRISMGFYPLLLGLGFILFSSFSVSYPWILGLVGFYLLLWVWYQIQYFKTVKLSVSEDFLTRYSGLWIRKQQIIQMYKLQSVSVSQPLWYRKRGVVNLVFHTAGGDVHYPFVNQNEALGLRDYLLYKIEATEKPWM